ncbi:MAG: class I SAM-dependent methyltransferase [Candidatus Xenobia bacterium]
MLDAYLTSHQPAMLNLGCGSHPLKNWFNTDLNPTGDAVYLDLTRPFPVPDGTFHYIYAEHVIEHLDVCDAKAMANECYRVLISGGRIRLITPDVAFYASMYLNEPSPEEAAFIRYVLETYDSAFHEVHPPVVGVLNNLFYNYGHRCIYDKASLVAMLSSVGFVDAHRHRIQESDDACLCNLERHEPEWVNRLESLVIEAVKP